MTVDGVILAGFHWAAYLLLGLVCLYFTLKWSGDLLCVVYKQLWRAEVLVRLGGQCSRNTTLRPPSRYIVDGVGVPQKRNEHGEWYQPEDEG